MKKVLITLVVLFAFANLSANLNFADSKAWKQFTNVANASSHVAKFRNFIYINNYCYVIDSDTRSWICDSRYGVSGVAFDNFGNTWVISDTNLICLGPTDTTIYTAAKSGFPAGIIRSIFCDKVGGRLMIGTDQGIGISRVDSRGRPTTWTNALSVKIHQIVVSAGKVFAINNTKVYWLNSSGVWDNYDGLKNPLYGAIDKDGNLWLTFCRLVSGTIFERGLVKFDGQEWREYLVSTNLTSAFGNIVIDRDNILWFSRENNGIGSIDLSTVTVSNRIPEGTYSWAPIGQQVAISKDENGYVIFSGARGGVYAISPSAVRNPAIVRNFPRGDGKVVGTFDLKGRNIENSSFSSAHSSVRLVAVRTYRGIQYQKSLSTR